MTNISVTVHDHHRHYHQETDLDLETTIREIDLDHETMIKMIRLAAGGDAEVQERHLDLTMTMMISTTRSKKTRMMVMFHNVISRGDLVHDLPKERDPYLETMTNGKTR